MRLFTTITRTVFAMAFGAFVGATSLVWAQALTPPQAATSCEAQLEDQRRQNINLREVYGQSIAQIAALERAVMDANKKLAEAEHKGKAAEKK